MLLVGLEKIVETKAEEIAEVLPQYIQVSYVDYLDFLTFIQENNTIDEELVIWGEGAEASVLELIINSLISNKSEYKKVFVVNKMIRSKYKGVSLDNIIFFPSTIELEELAASFTQNNKGNDKEQIQAKPIVNAESATLNNGDNISQDIYIHLENVKNKSLTIRKEIENAKSELENLSSEITSKSNRLESLTEEVAILNKQKQEVLNEKNELQNQVFEFRQELIELKDLITNIEKLV